MAEQDNTKKLDPLEWAMQLASEAAKRLDTTRASTPQTLFLPGFDIGAMPNHLNRSSLFAPVARGKRRWHRQTAMVTRKDCVLEYTGEQLDEADADIIMALIAHAQPFPLGTPVPLNRAELLRTLGRSAGKHDYEWLHRRIKALTEATLFLEAKKPDGSTRYTIGKTVSFRIIAAFVYDGTAQTYSYTLDPRWVQLFGNHEYALIDWDKRLQIGRGQDMAKTPLQPIDPQRKKRPFFASTFLLPSFYLKPPPSQLTSTPGKGSVRFGDATLPGYTLLKGWPKRERREMSNNYEIAADAVAKVAVQTFMALIGERASTESLDVLLRAQQAMGEAMPAVLAAMKRQMREQPDADLVPQAAALIAHAGLEALNGGKAQLTPTTINLTRQ